MNTEYLANMAYSRSEYINKTTEHLRGAMTEWYCSRTGIINGLPNWTIHWESEARRLIRSFAGTVAHPVNGAKNRRKALAKAFAELKKTDAPLRAYAVYVVATDNSVKEKGLSQIADAVRDEFWSMVDATVDALLDANGELRVPYEKKAPPQSTRRGRGKR